MSVDGFLKFWKKV
jgi:peptidylprolyl isomerase domain and WD repeat-containing protein 1